MSDHSRRFSFFVTGAATVGFLAAMALPANAGSTSVDEAKFVRRVQSERESRKIVALSLRADLSAIARRHSVAMASTGVLAHDPALSSEIRGWQAIGENVGMGVSVDAIHQAFMHSPVHRSNILDPQARLLGVGVSKARGVIFVTEIFVQPSSPPAAPRVTSAGIGSSVHLRPVPATKTAPRATPAKTIAQPRAVGTDTVPPEPQSKRTPAPARRGNAPVSLHASDSPREASKGTGVPAPISLWRPGSVPSSRWLITSPEPTRKTRPNPPREVATDPGSQPRSTREEDGPDSGRQRGPPQLE